MPVNHTPRGCSITSNGIKEHSNLKQHTNLCCSRSCYSIVIACRELSYLYEVQCRNLLAGFSHSKIRRKYKYKVFAIKVKCSTEERKNYLKIEPTKNGVYVVWVGCCWPKNKHKFAWFINCQQYLIQWSIWLMVISHTKTKRQISAEMQTNWRCPESNEKNSWA